MTPQLAAENGIAIIYQEFNNVKELSAAENLFLGRPIRKGIIVDKKAMEDEAEQQYVLVHSHRNAKIRIAITQRQRAAGANEIKPSGIKRTKQRQR